MNTHGYIFIYLFRSTPKFDDILKEIDDRSLTISDFRWHQDCLRFEEDQEKLMKKIDDYDEKTQKLYISPALQRMSTHMRDYVKIQYDNPSDEELNFSPAFLRFLKDNKVDVVMRVGTLEKFDEIYVYRRGVLICDDQILKGKIKKREVDKKYKKYAKYVKVKDIEKLDPMELINAALNTDFRW